MSSNLRTSGSSKFQCKPTPECLHTFTYHGAFCLQPQDRRVIQGAVGCARSSVKNEQLNIGRVCFWRSCLHHLTYSNNKLERERNPGCNQQNCLSELMHPTIVWALKFWLNSASPMAQKKHLSTEKHQMTQWRTWNIYLLCSEVVNSRKTHYNVS